MNHLHIPKKINLALTKRVITLHSDGYIFDFSVTADYRILCIQDGRLFTTDQVTIKVVDIIFDQITFSFKYVHTAETCCGDKGLLIACCLCGNGILTAKVRMSALPEKQVFIGKQDACKNKILNFS